MTIHQRTPESPAPETAGIIDNRNRRIGEFLEERIEKNSSLSVVSAYFTIYAYEALRVALEYIGGMRFLYGDPQSAVASVSGLAKRWSRSPSTSCAQACGIASRVLC